MKHKWMVRYIGTPEAIEGEDAPEAQRMESEIVGTLADVIAAHPEATILAIVNHGAVIEAVDEVVGDGVVDAGKGSESMSIEKHDVGDVAAVLGGDGA